MATLRLGDTAPDFTAATTAGPIRFHEWLGHSWGVLFSHPADYTPVCTTELGATARLKPEFDKRNVKVAALSVDPLASHHGWVKDIEEVGDCRVEFPIIADEAREVAELYGMIHPNANASLTVRSLFIIAPDKTIKLIITYPASTGRNFQEILRVIDSLQLTAEWSVSTPADWRPGEEVVIGGSISDADADVRFKAGFRKVKPYLRLTADPQHADRMRIAIVGGGLGGTLAGLQLLRSGPPHLHATLIERRTEQLHRGLAYSARISQQLLNVPAARMGLFPDAVDGFYQWAVAGDMPHAAKADFLPRHRFGDFVQEQFRQARERHPGRITVPIGEAVGMDRAPSGKPCLKLAGGERVETDRLLLALGHAPSGDVPHLTPEARRHPRYIPFPWKPGVLDTIGPHEHVLFVGSGLTMVDLLLSLKDQGHQGPVTVVSRRGFLPGRHAAAAPWALSRPAPDMRAAEMADLLRWMRNEVRQAAAVGVAWPNVIDAARPCVQGWWQALSTEKRRAFLRHLRPFWEVHRHRMPPEVHGRITALRRSGDVRVLAARIRGVEVMDERLLVTLDHRQGGPEILAADRLINCTGPESDARRLDQPLLTDLLAQGVLCRDELGLGLQCTAEGVAIGRDGRVSDEVFLLGPMCKAALWECTAVPEIRDQVAQWARRFSGAVPLAG